MHADHPRNGVNIAGRFTVKDGEDSKQVGFKLVVVDLGLDPDGDPVTSCAVVPDLGAIFRRTPPQGRNQVAALAAIRKAINGSTLFGHAGAPPNVACVPIADVIAKTAGVLVGVEAKRRTARANEAVRGLIIGGHLRSGFDAQQGEWIWL